MSRPTTVSARMPMAVAALTAALAIAGPSAAQDFSTIYESQDFPLENRTRTVILQEDLRPRSYAIVLAPRTLVVDNHAEVVARRSGSSFDARFEASVERQEEIYALYRRLSH